jgi:F-type H+-transporting ATPase subunit gamma
MANLKEIRGRITSISSTMQITSAMKMVSAAKLKRAQDAIQQMRPYAEKLQNILSNLSASLDSNEGQFSATHTNGKALIVLITSNRGLCGAFNSSAIKAALAYEAEQSEGKNVDYLCLGKKGMDYLKRRNYSVSGDHNAIWEKLNFDNGSAIAQEIMDSYLSGKYEKVILVYNSFKNAASQVVKVEQFLPVEIPKDSKSTGEYLFEPGKKEIVEQLIPQSLKTQLFKALLDSQASEHGARMTAMHKATDNAKELKKELSLTYNKLRQASITNEILEIVGGAEALKN